MALPGPTGPRAQQRRQTTGSAASLKCHILSARSAPRSSTSSSITGARWATGRGGCFQRIAWRLGATAGHVAHLGDGAAAARPGVLRLNTCPRILIHILIGMNRIAKITGGLTL